MLGGIYGDLSRSLLNALYILHPIEHLHQEFFFCTEEEYLMEMLDQMRDQSCIRQGSGGTDSDYAH